MSATLVAIGELAAQDDILISAHGYDELAQDDISIDDVIAGLSAAILVEDYPDYPKGPSVLVLQRDAHGRPVHVVWGIPRGTGRPGGADHCLSPRSYSLDQ